MSSTRRIAAIALTAGPLLHLLAEAVAALGWRGPTYSYLHNWISDLGVPDPGTFQGRAIDSPLHDVMNTGFLAGGIALIVGLVLLSRDLPARIRRTTRALALTTGTGYALVGLTHTSTAAATDGTLVLHLLGAFLAILGGNALAITLGIHWWGRPVTRRLGHASVPLGLLGIAAVVVLGFTATSTSAPNGLIERIAVYTVIVWQLRTALHLVMPAAHPSSNDDRRRQPSGRDRSPDAEPSEGARRALSVGKPDRRPLVRGRPADRFPHTGP